MPEESSEERGLSLEELDEVLAEATDSTTERIRTGAGRLEIDPLKEAERVEE